MATKVYTTEEIELLDETTVVLKPLAIRPLREFMDLWSEYIEYLQSNSVKDEEERDGERALTKKQFDVFTDMVILCVKKELFAKVVADVEDDKKEEAFRDYIEDTVDEQTIYRILDKCGGLKLNDPNQLASLAAAAGMN